MNAEPWFAPSAIDFLRLEMRPHWKILETGSGGSTVWYAERVKKVVSFEHDKIWHERVKKALEERKLGNVDLRFDVGYPTNGIPELIERFNLISVDGRGRVKSVKTAIDYLEPDGFVLLDNSERSEYASVYEMLDSWERFDFGEKDRWTTTIWKKS
jgi:protein-L-isoaspartate O-methyltransferase